jgi:tRNA(Ile)-lysidine synthase
VLSATPEAAPLRNDEFAVAIERLAHFETRPFVAIAVSGGPDSLALTLLADRWARRRGGHIRALSVDHGLRPESGGEIELLRGWLAARGIRHETLLWVGEKPATGIQEKARAARYRLLDAWCCDNGCLHLLTAHHRQDQIETYLIRRRAGSGEDGLAAMSAVRELSSCRILRPLLGVDRARLVALLAAERQPFIEDPSNRNPAFERAQLRLSGGGADFLVMTEHLRELGAARRARERLRDAALARIVRIHPAGFAAIEAEPFRALPQEAAEAVTAALTAAIGGAPYPARRAGVARLCSRLADMSFSGHTLGGCRFLPWRRWILVLRELAAAQPPVLLQPGEILSWDGRYRIAPAATAPAPVSIGYLAQLPSGLAGRIAAPHGRRLPRLAHPTLPAAWNQDGLLGVPHLGYAKHPAAALPEVRFDPVISLSRPGFAVV